MMKFSPVLLRYTFRVALSAFLLQGIAPNVRAGSLSYTIIDLGGLGGVSNVGFVSEAFGVNATGQVVGDSVLSNGTDLSAFRTGPGGQPINNLGGSSSTAFAINDSGQSAGQSTFAGTLSAFRTDPNGSITSGSNLGILPGGSFSIGQGINASGQVVGSGDTSTANGTEIHAFRTTSNGGLNAASDLGVLSGMNGSQAFGINNSGQAVGNSFNTSTGAELAFRADPGAAMKSLGLLSGGTFSTAAAINSSAMVVGNADTSSAAEVAYRTTAGGDLSTATILGFLSGGSFSSALGINDLGWVVGVGDTSTSSQDAWVWNGSGSLVDLNTVLVNGQGWELFSATGINDAGEIVGTGELNGQTDAFLLIPVPEPGTLIMAWTSVVVGLVLAWRRRRATTHMHPIGGRAAGVCGTLG
jgi:probable HAF family extracellular repeat protein